MNGSSRILLASLLLSGGAAAQQAPYDIPWRGYDVAVYPEAHLPMAQRVADFDGDGVADLATVSWYSNSRLSILMGDGQGGFEPPVHHTLVLGSLGIDAADMDGDGDLDLVVSATGQSWEGNSFLLFTNLGDGTFVQTGQFAAGVGPNGIAAADFNGDGLMDVAVAHDAYIVCASTVAAMYQLPQGGFSAPQIRQIDSCTSGIDAGDLNGDGLADLAVAHEGSRMTVLLSTGLTFAPAVAYPGLPSGFFPDGPNTEIADVDLDGDLDVLYAHADMGYPLGLGAIALYRNNGAGTFAGPEQVDLIPGERSATDIEVADLTGDGWPDLLTANHQQVWCFVPGDGAGGFGPAQELHAGEAPFQVGAGDLDQDGDLDVIVLGSGSREACVYLNPGNGTFVQPPYVPQTDLSQAPTSHSQLVARDFDGDGDLDLAVGFSHNFNDIYGLTVRRQQPGGGFASPEVYTQFYFPEHVAAGDIDLDGDLDLVFGGSSFPWRIDYRLNLGDGTFGPLQPAKTFSNELHELVLADVNGDGKLDLLAGAYGQVGVYLRNATGWGPRISHAIGGESTAIALGDFDGDGDLDMATNSGVQGYVEISKGNGDGTFQPPTFYQTGRDVHAIDVGDVDHDGVLDLACAYNLDGKGLTILRGRPDGSFKPPFSFHGSSSATYDNEYSILLADVDGDGELDALVPNYGSQDISVWLGNGDATFQLQQRWGVGQPGWDVAFGDFSGDGVADIAVQVHPWEGAGGWYFPAVVVLEGGAGGAVQAYCTAKLTSNGCVPSIGWQGSPSAGGGFTVTASDVEATQLGLAFWSTGGDNKGGQPFQGGFLCVTPPVVRQQAMGSGGASACTGSYATSFDAVIASLAPGTVVYAQYWFRDPGVASGTGLSDALAFTVQP